MKIGIDIDGVISNFVKTFARIVKNKYEIALKEEEIFCHDLFQVLGIPEEEAKELIRETLTQDLTLIPRARWGINELKQEHEIYLISARFKDLTTITENWLKSKKIPYDKILYLDEGNKHQASLQLDVIIEDNLKDAIGWLGKVKEILIFDHPWNRSLDVKKSFHRVRNWSEIVEFVKLASKITCSTHYSSTT
ncbi:MAG: 5' nucleotidase, deoxy (Pyrimidine), cytosolic type C protein (NT5C) [Candidatus Bathyarchaeota archaeon BA2]|nr:MAG: 5' nucleotidase, deoxy (Pyrimidine), cytosolic type C protein (NT5C) [Candidatus Bathyarchaeota archaeon BA2]